MGFGLLCRRRIAQWICERQRCLLRAAAPRPGSPERELLAHPRVSVRATPQSSVTSPRALGCDDRPFARFGFGCLRAGGAAAAAFDTVRRLLQRLGRSGCRRIAGRGGLADVAAAVAAFQQCRLCIQSEVLPLKKRPHVSTGTVLYCTVLRLACEGTVL